MNKQKQANKRNTRRKIRARAKLYGTAERPRLSVFKSNTRVYVQAIDDAAQKTVVQAASTKGAKELAEIIATRLKEKKIASGIFDRGASRYHGFMKELADTIRKNGIQI
jgi:large subunit ribosomal protein L18